MWHIHIATLQTLSLHSLSLDCGTGTTLAYLPKISRLQAIIRQALQISFMCKPSFRRPILGSSVWTLFLGNEQPINRPFLQPNGLTEVQCEFFGPISGLNFGRWILGGEFLEGEFFRGPLLLGKIEPKNSTPEFGSGIRASKIRFPEFGAHFLGKMRHKQTINRKWTQISLVARCTWTS